MSLYRVEVDISKLLTEMLEDIELLAPHLTVRSNIAKGLKVQGDPARTWKVEGLGLGLSLAREIVRAHQGELKLDSSHAGQTAFIFTLPKTA